MTPSVKKQTRSTTAIRTALVNELVRACAAGHHDVALDLLLLDAQLDPRTAALKLPSPPNAPGASDALERVISMFGLRDGGE